MEELDLGATIRGFSPGQKVFSRYTLKKLLGRGGMGVVWLARDAILERDLAIKMLPELVANDPVAVRDLKRETIRSQRLNHQHILRIYDFAEGGGLCGITMEIVEGGTLSARRLEQPGEVYSVESLWPLVQQLCATLDYAHGKAQIIHRDLKPSNLMLDASGDLKVADFGIAASVTESVSRVSANASSSGSPPYMSPQQLDGRPPKPADDIYALGATLYELLSGKPPFYSGGLAGIINQIKTVVPPLLVERRQELGVDGDPIPQAWEQVIAACLAKEPQDRPPTAGEVARRLRLVEDHFTKRTDSGRVAKAAPNNLSIENADEPSLRPKRGSLPPKPKAPLGSDKLSEDHTRKATDSIKVAFAAPVPPPIEAIDRPTPRSNEEAPRLFEYSGYQLKRSHSLGPFASVYESTAPDDKPGRFALKIFHPPPSTNIQRAYALEGWLLAAERQQKCAKKDGAVLEILAFGRCEEGAYAVMPWQDHPLEPLVETLAAKDDLLRALAECLLSAIEQWELQTGGSHLKLKASNVFLTRSGPLAGMTAVLSDPWFQDGTQTGLPLDDLPAVGAILAQIVRRQAVTIWPIEDAPEWKALGHPGKSWLAYVNFLLDPKPATGAMTVPEARKRLRAIPKPVRPTRTAMRIGLAAILVLVGGALGFARFGDPIYMPLNLRKLAEAVRNPRTVRVEVTPNWARLCRAWDSWLGDLQSSAPRLLRTEGLWAGPNDPLRVEIANFNATARNLRPGAIVPEAAGEKRMSVLGDSPPDVVRNEVLKTRVAISVDHAYWQINNLATQLEQWSRWEEMRKLLAFLKTRGFKRAAVALEYRLPPVPDVAGYKTDTPGTLKLFNDVSLDEAGTLPLAKRWSEIMRLKAEMESSGDRIQMAMPELILARLADRSSIGDFADSLEEPLEGMRLRRKQFLDPSVDRERFLKESPLQRATTTVTMADILWWEQELARFSKGPAPAIRR